MDRRNTYGILKGTVILSMFLLFQACTEDSDPTAEMAIGFSNNTLPVWTSPNTSFSRNDAAGRATTSIEDFGVYALLGTNNKKPGNVYGSSTIRHMDGIKVYNDGGKYTYSPNKYWPGVNYWAQFYAYSPFDFATKAGCSVDIDGHTPKINFTNNANVDLLAAKSEVFPGNYNQTVTLPFEHILSCIEVKKGDMPDGINITAVSLSGIRNKGSYNMVEDSWDTTGTDAKEYTISLGDSYYMLPHDLLENAKINIKTSDGESYTKDISDWEWVKGKKYIYTISIEVTPDKQYEVTIGMEETHYQENENVIW